VGDEADGASGGAVGPPAEPAGGVLGPAPERVRAAAIRAAARAGAAAAAAAAAEPEPDGEHTGRVRFVDEEGRDACLQRLAQQ